MKFLKISVSNWLFTTLLLAAPAHAQLLDPYLPPLVTGIADEPAVTVLSRQRPDYENGGIRAGSFIIRPQLTESAGYESNVPAQPRAQGSAVIDTLGSVAATSDLSRHSLSATATVDDVRYPDLPNQSYTNWSARLGGTFDVGRDLASFEVSHQNLNQTLRDLDVPQLNMPLAYVIDSVRAGYRATFNRLSITPSLEAAHYSYNSGLAGNAVYAQNYRNRSLLTPGIAMAYEFAPRRSAIIVVRNTSAFYTNGAPQQRRNYNDTAALTGIDYDLTGILRVRALVGYESRTFSSAAYGTIAAPVAEFTLIWNPTGLTTLTAGLTRRIQDSADETVSGITTTTATLRADHEFRRNILLAAVAGLERGEYRTGAAQTLYTASVGATYLLNRYAALGAKYEFIARENGGNQNANLNGFALGPNYVDHRILLQLRLAL